MFRFPKMSFIAWLIVLLLGWIGLALYSYSYYSGQGLRDEFLTALFGGIILATPFLASIISNNLSNNKLGFYILATLNFYIPIYAVIMILYLSGNLNFLTRYIGVLEPVERLNTVEQISGEDRKEIVNLLRMGRNEPDRLINHINEIKRLLLKYPDSYSIITVHALYLVEKGDLDAAKDRFDEAVVKATRLGDIKAQVENLSFIATKIELQRDNYEAGLRICKEILSLAPDNQQAKHLEKYFDEMVKLNQKID